MIDATISTIYGSHDRRKAAYCPFSSFMNTMSDINTTNQEPVLTDEQILEFEQQIKDEEAQKVIFIWADFIHQCI